MKEKTTAEHGCELRSPDATAQSPVGKEMKPAAGSLLPPTTVLLRGCPHQYRARPLGVASFSLVLPVTETLTVNYSGKRGRARAVTSKRRGNRLRVPMAQSIAVAAHWWWLRRVIAVPRVLPARPNASVQGSYLPGNKR
ncbi:hypothetical protein BRADI_3g49365v3 [Brachypodium distachyon]|uniref:Uncharacterized protein n=1 Tax=Brachypodium distachyon TaxID=15368 RepID=A0A0Q3M7L9_BRADI|nr:hypothetical protein BRADI_3g49365v3 [Brachypodium distachyon]